METSQRKTVRVDNPVVLVDGTAEAKAWLGDLVAQARGGLGDWPHPHPAIPAARITLAQLHNAISANYTVDGKPWSVAQQGYPPLQGGPPSVAAVAGGGPTDVAAVHPPDDPSKGSSSHNVLHSILGDFH
jgi:hypothetical protein